MEDVIFYLLVAGAVVVNIVRNYRKVSKQNKERDISKPVSQHSKETQTASPKQTSKRVDIPKSYQEQESRKKRETVSVKPEFQQSTPSFKYESLESMGSLESLDYQHEMPAMDMMTDFDEQASEDKNIIKEKTSIDLQLDTREGLKRAFVHSLIFDRKY